MSIEDSISTIQAAERDAEQKIAAALESSQAKKIKHQEKFAHSVANLKNELAKDESKIFSKYNAEAEIVKQQLQADSQTYLKNVKKVATARIQSSVDFVFEKFGEYVGK